jgi:hypothetical protein
MLSTWCFRRLSLLNLVLTITMGRLPFEKYKPCLVEIPCCGFDTTTILGVPLSPSRALRLARNDRWEKYGHRSSLRLCASEMLSTWCFRRLSLLNCVLTATCYVSTSRVFGFPMSPVRMSTVRILIRFPYNQGLLSTSKGSHWHTDTRTELRSRVHSRCQASKTLLLSVQVRAELVRPRLP